MNRKLFVLVIALQLVACSGRPSIVEIDGVKREIATSKSDKTFFHSRKDAELLGWIYRSLESDYKEENFTEMMDISDKIDNFQKWEQSMGDFIANHCGGEYKVKRNSK